MILIAKKKLNYGCKGTIQLGLDTCSVCNQDKHCLIVDGSENEYGAMGICEKCTVMAFDKRKITRIK